MIRVHSIVYQPDRSENKAPFHFNRVPVDCVQLIADHGIQGDFKAGRNPKRQLNLMSRETLDTLRAQGYKTEPGEMGEQIVLGGLDVMTLQPGDQLQLGDSACIEITARREPCAWFALVQEKPYEIAREACVGVLARVVASGEVRQGDLVTLRTPIKE
ncbi:MAG: MOSC domain-containing protein [Anaerolineae bacterium]|nr:MOSC domain-containing protein [Anaerolineae bacterium]